MVENLIKLNQDKIKYYTSIHDEKNLKKHQIIQNILSEPKAFNKMPIEMAYGILLDLGFERSNLAKIYYELTRNNI